MSRIVWELLTFNERICPSCKSSWIPDVDNPVSCPRCKSYSLSKTRQPWPEGFVVESFYYSDFDIRDISWKVEQDKLDKEQRARKNTGFEQIHANWMRNSAKVEQKNTSQIDTETFTNRNFIPTDDDKMMISKKEVHRLIRDLGVLNRHKP